MSGRDDGAIGYDVAGAMLATDCIMREAVAKEEGDQTCPRGLLPVYVQSATLIYAAERIATALEAVAEAQGRLAGAAENIGAETGFAAEALERLTDVSGYVCDTLGKLPDVLGNVAAELANLGERR